MSNSEENSPVYTGSKESMDNNKASVASALFVKCGLIAVTMFLSIGLWTGEGMIASGSPAAIFLLLVIAWHLVEDCQGVEDKRREKWLDG